MANNAAAARARRKLKAPGAKSCLSIDDPQSWLEILHEQEAAELA
jgi:hypothetical protein